MTRVAEFYGRELNKRVATLAKADEPVMLLVIGVVVGLIVASLILPIFKVRGPSIRAETSARRPSGPQAPVDSDPETRGWRISLHRTSGMADGSAAFGRLWRAGHGPARALNYPGTTTRGASPMRRARRANCLSSNEAMLSQPR